MNQFWFIVEQCLFTNNFYNFTVDSSSLLLPSLRDWDLTTQVTGKLTLEAGLANTGISRETYREVFLTTIVLIIDTTCEFGPAC